MLGIEPQKQYITIKEGKLVLKTSDKEQLYDFIEGRVKNITKITRQINNVMLDFYLLQIDDYLLSLKVDSGLTLSVLNSLVSVEGVLDRVKIRTYYHNGYSKVIVSSNGERLQWKYPPEEIPKKSVSGRVLFIEGLVEELKTKIVNDEALEEPF